MCKWSPRTPWVPFGSSLGSPWVPLGALGGGLGANRHLDFLALVPVCPGGPFGSLVGCPLGSPLGPPWVPLGSPLGPPWVPLGSEVMQSIAQCYTLHNVSLCEYVMWGRQLKKMIFRVVDFFRFRLFYKVVIVNVNRKCQKENEIVFFRTSTSWLCFLAILKLFIALNVLNTENLLDFQRRLFLLFKVVFAANSGRPKAGR